MEFINSNFKQKNQNGRKQPKSGSGAGGGGRQYENGSGGSSSNAHLNHNQYQQFVNNAIQRGRGGFGQVNGINNSQDSVFLLQALQQQQQVPNGSQSLGNMFQELSQKNKYKEQRRNVNGGIDGVNIIPGLNFSGAVKNKVHPNIVPLMPQLPSQSHEELTLQLNREALLRVDPSFVRLYGSASQVAIYDYAVGAKDWIDSKTVGCLFLYSRLTSPEYGLVVLNRKGLKNLVMFFDKQSQVIPQWPYLLFRRGPDEVIKCVWFYQEKEFNDATEIFRSMGVQFDQCDSMSASNSQKANTIALCPNLFDMLKESQKKVDESSNVSNVESKPKVITAEELEQQMFNDPSPPIASGVLHGLNLNSLGAAGVSAGTMLEKLSLAKLQIETGESGNNESKRKPTTSGDSDSTDSLPPGLKVANRSMRTVEQLEKDLMPEATKADMSSELLATLGIAPVKDVPESSSEIYSQDSPFLTPTSRSLSESDRSQKKLTIDDLDGKLYEETDEEMVQEVVEGLADLTELLLLSENVPGFSEPQLVWRKRSNLQNRPPSALIQVPHINGNGMAQNHQKYMSNNSPIFSNPSMSPLTQSQLLQAITYLLQTDPSFVAKIHDGYIKSLQQTWANNRLG